MSTSIQAGIENILSAYGSPALLLAADRPLTTDMVRAVADNWHHAYDESTQFRINWAAMDAASPVRITLSPSTADTYELMHSFGPFPWTIRYDGEYMRPVYRLAGSTDNASYTVTFKLCFMLDAQPFDHLTALDSVELATASTTDAYLVPTDNYLSPDPASNSPFSSLREYKTLIAPSGDATASQILQCRADVWVKATNASATGRLAALMIREYIGT